MDINQYLERINFTDSPDLDVETLSKLQFRHLMAVPFENLGIHNSTRIDLSNLFNKIVIRKRGGFCYELNGLFYELLAAIGFNVKMISASVYEGTKGFSPEFDHMALIVTLKDDQYLVDVGFGEFAFYPVKMELNKDTSDPGGVFRIETSGENHQVIMKKKTGEAFVPEYMFDEKERTLDEFYERCNYHQTNKESHFMQKRICSLPTKNGRITLTGNTLKITENGEVKQRQLNNEQEIRQVLWDYFGIKLV